MLQKWNFAQMDFKRFEMIGKKVAIVYGNGTKATRVKINQENTTENMSFYY